MTTGDKIWEVFSTFILLVIISLFFAYTMYKLDAIETTIKENQNKAIPAPRIDSNSLTKGISHVEGGSSIPDEPTSPISMSQRRMDVLLDAIMEVEGGFIENTFLDGDSGCAKGHFQIHEFYWRDGIKFLGVDWPYLPDVYNLNKSKQVVEAYLNYYYDKLIVGFDIKDKWAKWEIMASIHNGGPRGYGKKYTKPYWERVKAVLIKLEKK